MGAHIHPSIRVTWNSPKAAYTVNVPGWDGGEVVPVEIVNDLVAALKGILRVTDRDHSAWADARCALERAGYKTSEGA